MSILMSASSWSVPRGKSLPQIHTTTIIMTYFKTTISENIGELILNRPARLNVMDDTFFTEFHDAVKRLDVDPDVRVILVRAEGKVFTAGLDMKWATSIFSDDSAPSRADASLKLHKLIKRWQDSFTALEKTLKPVVAAIHGKCIGGGVDLVTAADIRLATKDVEFSIKETQIAIVADLGTLQRIGRIVPKGIVREMTFTGEPINAEDALRWGLVNRVYDTQEQLLTAARSLCKRIAANSPLVVQGSKKVLQYAEDHTIEEGLDQVAMWNSAFLQSPDLIEAGTAFMMRRTPEFKSKL
eukprot:TRINITY_DN14142_c0_g1_i1.p1 TRINITY_DN14142_c0_g1~~TRINITY_DN14142_c0_g1_i1.p1  ORF type:complete len:298 (-),score=20.98 TRINITY_DN14142_c0_g1_i1:94-987(-)